MSQGLLYFFDLGNLGKYSRAAGGRGWDGSEGAQTWMSSVHWTNHRGLDWSGGARWASTLKRVVAFNKDAKYGTSRWPQCSSSRCMLKIIASYLLASWDQRPEWTRLFFNRLYQSTFITVGVSV